MLYIRYMYVKVVVVDPDLNMSSLMTKFYSLSVSIPVLPSVILIDVS